MNELRGQLLVLFPVVHFGLLLIPFTCFYLYEIHSVETAKNKLHLEERNRLDILHGIPRVHQKAVKGACMGEKIGFESTRSRVPVEFLY